MVETTWGRSNNRYTVQCFINYIDNKPVFQIWFGKYFEHIVSSVKSAMDVTNLFIKFEFICLKTLEIAKEVLAEFNEKNRNYINLEDVPALESICYSVNKKHTFNIYYENEDKTKKKQKLESIIRALDEGNIPRDSYRHLCAIEYNLSREGEISKEHININEIMIQLIPIIIVDINTKSQVDESEGIDIDDESITQEVINAIDVLNPDQPIINF
ncbi:hypothetical protein C1646_749876 [Rhizophagus diaphanus]|nr:hypothetical protein C1646_749876 [Rhizophagus diaphanus] [Rhizophagus sp. MUCL 43196]